MKKLLAPLFFIVTLNCFAQAPVADATVPQPVNKLFAQDYNKDMTEYLAKVYIARDVLKLQENELTGFQIDAVNGARSNELTTVMYNCPKLNQKGIVLVFWDSKQYSFYHFEYSDAVVLLDRISSAIESNKEILDEVNTSVLKSNDIHFIFESSSIKVVWNQYDLDWDRSNFKATYKRFDRFLRSNFNISSL